jgi:hypothetical protein
MARKQESRRDGMGRLRRVADAIGSLFTRGRGDHQETAEARSSETRRQASSASSESQPRTVRRETDIPLDTLDRHYTPPLTSSKASFRSDGADHGRDQEFALGVADDRWNDEDRITNKSGDPRIGTHRRTYEPGEDRAESRES